eukprot:6471063-Prymnesium_polylepis.1
MRHDSFTSPVRSAAHPRPPSTSLCSLRRSALSAHYPPANLTKPQTREAAAPGWTNVPSGLGCPPVP